MRFPKPRELKSSLPESTFKNVTNGYLPKSHWIKNWTRDTETLSNRQRVTATNLIARINNVMDELGRPFGHRMGQAMLHYVANYPKRNNDTDQVSFALADQVEQRILPRLRGVVVEEKERHLRELAELVERDVGDKALGTEIESCVKRSRDTNGLFVWRGFGREQG